MNHREIFSGIYQHKVWGALSGGGAEPAVAGPFANLVRQHSHSRRVLDIGCGDGWAASQYGVEQYTGIDVVPAMVEYCRNHHAWGKFLCLNALTDPLPDADVVLCKEVTQHLPYADILKLVEKLRRYPMALHCSAIGGRGDIEVGAFRGVRLSDLGLETEPLGEWGETTRYHAELWRPK